MTTFTFTSLANSNLRYRLYAVDSENPAYDWTRRTNEISRYLSAYDTMGNGETQHAPDYLPQQDQAGDVFRSFLAAIVDIPDGELPDAVHSFLRDGETSCDDMIRFAWALKYRESKNQYVNLNELKTSSSDSKRHDKRWLKLESYYCPQTTESSDKIGALSCVLFHDDNPRREYSFIGRLAVLLRAGEIIEESYLVFEHIRKWHCFKDSDREEVRQMINDFQLINQWFDARRTAYRIQGIAKRLTERLAVA